MAGIAGLAVLVVVLLVAAVRYGAVTGDEVADPPAHTLPPAAVPPGSVVSTTAERPHGKKQGATEKVPRAVILRQLARVAERIANHMPMPTTPAEVRPGSNQALGYSLLIEFGFDKSQWPYLNALWNRESGWNQLAENKSSGAYGIPQSLPGTKMAVVGPDWRTNPETQIKWGLAYISARYGNPQGAWAHSQRFGWY
ncbi:hypothetical protein GCM10027076_18430 [Nocardioides montaniterrae]